MSQVVAAATPVPTATSKPNLLRRLFLALKDVALGWCNEPARTLLEQESTPLFTFAVALIFQMFYLYWLLAGGSVQKAIWLWRWNCQLNIALLLLSGAAIRCLVAYLIYADQDVEDDTIFDYPSHSKSIISQAKKAKSVGGMSDGRREDEAAKK